MQSRGGRGLGAIRQELKEATAERKDADLRIRRLRAAEAALHGRPSPNAKVLNRGQILSYLAEHPGSRSIEIADTLAAPANSVRTLLTTLKKAGEVINTEQRWYLSEHRR
jgi:predicted transcriptional regulator